MNDPFESFKKMIASGLPEVEKLEKGVAITESVSIDQPSVERRAFDGV